jgi:hypothetical protein
MYLTERAAKSGRVDPGFASTDADRFLDRGNEDLSVADPARLRRLADGFDRRFRGIVAEYDLDFHLGKKVNDIFGAAIEFGMAFLATKALGFGDRYSLKPDFLKRFLDLVEFERLDDCLDFFHQR